MSWLWIGLAVLVAVAGFGYVSRMRSLRSTGSSPAIDDDAIRRIVESGSLPADHEDEPLDLDEASRAEEEFWNESWDEPEEYG